MDIFRLVTIAPSGRAVLVQDLNALTAEGDGMFRNRDTFRYTPPTARVKEAVSDDRYVGSTLLSGGHSNASVASAFTILDSDPADAARRAERLLEHADTKGGRLLLEWRAEGLEQSVFFPIRGPAVVAPTYQAASWAQRRVTTVEVTWPVAPLAQGLPMTVEEDFAPPSDLDDGEINFMRFPSAENSVLLGWSLTNATQSVVSQAAPGGGTKAYQIQAVAAGTMEAWWIGTAGTTAFVTGQTPTIPGEAWSVGIEVRAATTGRPVRVGLRWCAADGSTLSTSWGNPTTTNSAGWSRITSKSAVAPAGTVNVAPVLEVQSAAIGEQHWFDEIMLTRTADSQTYADGDAADYRWEDAAHASRSIQLSEAKLAEWTLDENAADVIARQDSKSIDPPGGLIARAAGQLRMRHTGRGYGLHHPTVEVRFMTPDAFPTNWNLEIGKAVGDDHRATVSIEKTGATWELDAQRIANGVATESTGTSISALAVNRVYWLRYVSEGPSWRGELWDKDPNLASVTDVPLNTVGWGIIPLSYDIMGYGPGDAYVGLLGWDDTARILRVNVRPYAYLSVTSPKELDLKNVPGNAPALMDLDFHAPPTTPMPFALFGRWPEPAPFNFAVNGDLEDNLDHWYNDDVGGTLIGSSASTLARVATGGPMSNSAYAQVTTTAVANQGMVHRIARRLKRGRRYTAEFYAWTPSGSWQYIWGASHGVGGSSASNALPAGASSGWTRVAFDLAVTSPDIEYLEVGVRQTAATAGSVARVSALRVYEGTGPTGANHSEGRGAHPPVGLLQAEGDQDSSRIGFTAVTQTAFPSQRALRLSAAATGRAEWLVDTSLVEFGDEADDTLELDAYLLAILSSTWTAASPPALILSAVPWRVPSPASYTPEYGTAGKTIPIPPVAGARGYRLGTLVLPRSRTRDGRVGIRLDVSAPGAAAGTFDIAAILLTPRRRTASTPTGKAYDSTYPSFVPSSSKTLIKRIRHDLRGELGLPTGRDWAQDSGLGGPALTLDPGDNILLVWGLHNSVPDDPTNPSATSTIPVSAGYDVRVTPQYRLYRPE